MDHSNITGNYSGEVRNSSNEFTDRQIYDIMHLPFEFTANSENLSCKPAVAIDIIMINRTNYGSMAFCDFQLKGMLPSTLKN